VFEKVSFMYKFSLFNEVFSMARMMLRDEDWDKIQSFLPSQIGKQGRPRKNDRLVMEGILWALRTGAPWRDMPPEFGPWNTVYSRFSYWTKSGLWERIWGVLKNRCRPRITYP
jgi:transposase